MSSAHYISPEGTIYLDGKPEDTFVTTYVRPELRPGSEEEFDIAVDLADGTGKTYKAVPLRPCDEDPENFVYAELRERVDDDPEEERWELVDPEALLPRAENELLRVLGNFVANPDLPPEEQKGIRSRKLWLRLGGAAVATGATIAITGIIVKRRRQAQ